eukprot:20047-Heterococcus_DN1.PRE.3
MCTPTEHTQEPQSYEMLLSVSSSTSCSTGNSSCRTTDSSNTAVISIGTSQVQLKLKLTQLIAKAARLNIVAMLLYEQRCWQFVTCAMNQQ